LLFLHSFVLLLACEAAFLRFWVAGTVLTAR